MLHENGTAKSKKTEHKIPLANIPPAVMVQNGPEYRELWNLHKAFTERGGSNKGEREHMFERLIQKEQNLLMLTQSKNE